MTARCGAATASPSTAREWVSHLADAHAAGRFHGELTRLGRIPLLIVDEVGYIPFEAGRQPRNRRRA